MPTMINTAFDLESRKRRPVKPNGNFRLPPGLRVARVPYAPQRWRRLRRGLLAVAAVVMVAAVAMSFVRPQECSVITNASLHTQPSE